MMVKSLKQLLHLRVVLGIVLPIGVAIAALATRPAVASQSGDCLTYCGCPLASGDDCCMIFHPGQPAISCWGEYDPPGPQEPGG
jgi:hypothetical protein